MRNPRFLGVYSRKIQQNSGQQRTRLYFVWAVSPEDFAVQELDAALLPKAAAQAVKKNVFEANFRLEPSILAVPVSTPDMRLLAKSPPPARKAEADDVSLLRLEKARRAKQLENDMRNNFRKAISALSRPRDRQGALAAIEQLVRLKEGIVPAHKQMFRDFGVSLRKKKLLDLALASSTRVLELSPDDDHAHFNIARIYALLGAYGKALVHVERAMSIDGDEPVYSRLRAHIQRESSIKRK